MTLTYGVQIKVSQIAGKLDIGYAISADWNRRMQMNKKEAISSLQEMAQESFEVVKINAVHIDNIVEVVSQIDEPQKVTIPKFVAEWIKSQKESFSDVSAIDMYDNLTLDNNGGHYHDVWLWVIEHHYDFIKAWHDGYKVEQEKLYTVEIPNPNLNAHVVLQKTGDGLVLVTVGNARWRGWESSKLTEAEIKQDFEWAFQFAKPVEE